MRAHGILFIAVALWESACGGRASGDVFPPSVVFIRQVQRPIAPDCVSYPDPTGEFIGVAFLDVGISSRYVASLLVGNTSFAASDRSLPAGTEKIFQAHSASIHLMQSGTDLDVALTTPAIGTIDPGGRDPGYGLISVELIPSTIGSKLRTTLPQSATERFEIHVRISGVTLDGVEVETPDYVVPIDVCRGCSVVFPAESVLPTASGPNCLAELPVGWPGAGTACFPGQDGSVDCRICQSNPLCTPCFDDGSCEAFGATCLPSHQCG